MGLLQVVRTTTSDHSVFLLSFAGLSGCCAVRYRHPEGFLVYGETLSMRRKVCGWAEESSLWWKNIDGLESSQVGIFRTQVDEKVDKSGWRIKIVADGGYTHPNVGQKWVPGGALLSRGRVWPVDVPETLCKFMPTL